MIRTRALIATALLLAGCGEQPPSVLDTEAAQAKAVKALRGWDRVFAAPRDAVGAANQFGFAAAAYAASGTTPAYRASGKPVMMSSSYAKAPNSATFTLTGAKADMADRAQFTLTITDPADIATARKRFGQLVGDWLARFDIKDRDGVTQAIATGSDVDGLTDGAPASVDFTPVGSAMPTRIDVTFTRPEGSTPDTSKTRGQ